MASPNKDNLYSTNGALSYVPEVELVEGPDPNLSCPIEGCDGWAIVLINRTTGDPTKVLCSIVVPNAIDGCKARVMFSIYASKCPACVALINIVSNSTFRIFA